MVTVADLDQLEAIPLSRISDHRLACCDEARAVLLGRLVDQPDAGTALAAVPEVVRWSPTRWPTYWCELTWREPLRGDCGVHADLAGAVLDQFGVAYVRARAAIRPPPFVAAHWLAEWRDAGLDAPWISTTVVHHEVLHVGDRWWDPTEARWFEAGGRLMAGLVVATRDENGEWMLADGVDWTDA